VYSQLFDAAIVGELQAYLFIFDHVALSFLLSSILWILLIPFVVTTELCLCLLNPTAHYYII